MYHMRYHRRRHGLLLHLFFHLLLSATIFHVTIAQREDFKVAESQQNRRFSWSTEAPLRKAINDLAPAAIPHIDFLIQHTTRVESAVLKALKRDRFMKNEVVQPCNPAIPPKYRNSIPLSFGRRGFPEVGSNCTTDVPGANFDDVQSGYTMDYLYDVAFNHGAETKKHTEEISLRVIDNFTRPDVAFNFSYHTRSAQCSLTPVCMYRVGEFWRQAIGIHSHGLTDHLPVRGRTRISEIFRVVNGSLEDNLLMRLPKNDNGSVERQILNDTTTMIQFRSRTANPSCFRLIPIEENPAIIQALDDVDHFAQQAEDALSSSNLAILLLPLALNLVPISLFAAVSSRSMLLYTLMSDVLTVIPLGIKGVELVIISSRRFRAVITRITSGAIGNVTSTETAAGEIWGAECRVRDHVGRTGIALIITAVVFLIIGVSLELAARAYCKRRLRRGKGPLLGVPRSSQDTTDESDSLISSDIGAPGTETDEQY